MSKEPTNIRTTYRKKLEHIYETDAQSIVMRHMTHLMETTGVLSVLKQSVMQTITCVITMRTDELKKLVLKATVNKQTRRR